MLFLDLTLPEPAGNLALDEALLDMAEAATAPVECLRLWESDTPLVVLGRSSHHQREVNHTACAAAGVPVLRRCSGGAAIVAAQGCLMYAVVLSYEKRPYVRSIDVAHEHVLETMRAAIANLVTGVERLGISDLTWKQRKFSGNSLRCKRTHLLYHGTLLYQFPLELAARYLAMPPRQPDYRAGRAHEDFLINLPCSPHDLRDVVRQAWNADEPLNPWPREATVTLAENRYRQDSWNLRL